MIFGCSIAQSWLIILRRNCVSPFPFSIITDLCFFFAAGLTIKIDLDKASDFLIPGTKARLICSGGKSYNWTRPHVPEWADASAFVLRVTPSISNKGNDEVVSELIFDPITSTDGGNYTCSDGEGASATFALNVLHGKVPLISLTGVEIFF